MSNIRIVLATALLVLATQSVAAATNHPNLDADAIRAQQKQIRSDAEARKGPYKRLGEDKATLLKTHQDRVDQLLGADVRNTTELNEADQIALFNALESIESIVNDAEDNRMICERYKPTGSKRPKTVCMTVAERKAVREESMRDFGKSNLECSTAAMGPGGCQN